MGNLTLAIDDDLLRDARIRALVEETSVNAVVRDFLVHYVSGGTGRVACDAFLALAATSRASSGEGGRSWSRDDVYDHL